MASFASIAALRGKARLATLAAAFTVPAVYVQTSTPAAADAPAPTGALNPKEFIPLKIIEKQKLTANTWQYRFELPPGQGAGMSVASCLVTRAQVPGEDKPLVRPYTPTSSKDAQGYMDLIVKVYPTGKMSKHIGSLQVGDTLDIKGPIPKIAYKPNMKKHIAMIAGGTGITPMIQVIEEILSNPEDKTQISLMYGSMSEDDIILKDRIDRLAANYKGRFKVYYFIDSGRWKSGTLAPGMVRGVGFINKDKIHSFIPGPQEDVMVLVCGPPGMMQSISGPKAPDYSQGEVAGALKDLGYTKEQVFKF